MVYTVDFALSSKLWNLAHGPNKMVPTVDQFEEYVVLMYHLCPKAYSSGFVATGSVCDQSKLALAIYVPSKGFFNGSLGIKMMLTQEEESTAIVQPVSLFMHASMCSVPDPIACILAKKRWRQLLCEATSSKTMGNCHEYSISARS